MSTKPASEKTLQKLLNCENIIWSNIYNLGGEVTIDTYSRMFLYKFNHNILFLNKTLTRMGILNNSLCSFCNEVDESPIHMFSECHIVIQIWRDVQFHFVNVLNLPDLTPQSAFLGFMTFMTDVLLKIIFCLFLK